jgi:serine/threonine-protein kinase RsbW
MTLSPAAGPPAILWHLPPNVQAISEALGKLSPTLAGGVGSSDALDDLQLVLAEVLNNIAEHAYDGLPLRPIDLCVRVLPDGLHVETRDAGHRLPDHLLRPRVAPVPKDWPIGLLPEGGWGWALIHRLARDLRYERVGDRNRLRFVIPLSRPAEEAG